VEQEEVVVVTQQHGKHVSLVTVITAARGMMLSMQSLPWSAV
jgi:hypothetical protein